MLQKLTSNPKKIFFIDSMGGVLSALFLGVVLVGMQERIGMPVPVLYFLASIACFFALYSMCCHFLLSVHQSTFLLAITVANLLYCCTTIGLVLYFYDVLTSLGLLYFVLELFVLIALITIELYALSKMRVKENGP